MVQHGSGHSVPYLVCSAQSGYRTWDDLHSSTSWWHLTVCWLIQRNVNSQFLQGERQAISGGHHSQLWDVKNRQRYYHRRENTDLLLLVNPDWVLICAFFFLWYDSCGKSQFRCFKTWLLSCSVVSDSVVPQAVVHQASLFMGIVQVRILEWVAMPASNGSSQPRIKPRLLPLQVDSLPTETPGKP